MWNHFHVHGGQGICGGRKDGTYLCYIDAALGVQGLIPVKLTANMIEFIYASVVYTFASLDANGGLTARPKLCSEGIRTVSFSARKADILATRSFMGSTTRAQETTRLCQDFCNKNFINK